MKLASIKDASVTLQAVPVVKDSSLTHTTQELKDSLNYCYVRSPGAYQLKEDGTEVRNLHYF